MGWPMKVAYITPDWRDKQPGRRPAGIGGAGYYRCQLPADMLNRHNGGDIECQVFAGCLSMHDTGELKPIISPQPHYRGWNIDNTGWDIIVLQRWMAEEDADRIRRARACGQIVIQDVDDHFWGVHRHNRAHGDVRRDDWNAEYYKNNLAASDHITVSTQFLADYLEPLGVPITVLPNMIDLTQWQRQPVRDTVQTVGWCGHTGYRSGDLETLGNAIRHYLRDHPDITFIHGGHDPTSRHIADLLNIPKHRITTRPSCSIDKWPRIWQGIDVAILPLNTVEFNLAKSPIKAMEASAAGVPFIATEYGPYVGYRQGILVQGQDEWAAALRRMHHHETRRLLADQAWDHVQQHDAAKRWTDWADLYRNLTSERTAA